MPDPRNLVRLLVPLLLVLVSCGASAADLAPTAARTEPGSGKPGTRSMGDPQAPIQIIYYGDYQ